MYTYIYISPSKQLVVNVPVWLMKNKINLQINDSNNLEHIICLGSNSASTETKEASILTFKCG